MKVMEHSFTAPATDEPVMNQRHFDITEILRHIVNPDTPQSP